MKLFFCDVETTGTSYLKHGIIQLSGLVVIHGVERGHFDFRVKPFPQDTIDPDALQINGVSLDELQQFPEPRLIYAKLLRVLDLFVSKFDKQDKFIFLGWRADFDNQFLRQFFAKNGDKYFGSYFFNPCLDVMALALASLAGGRSQMENFKQETVAKFLEVSFDGEEEKFHDALFDIRTTKKILEKVYPDLLI